MKHLFLLLFLLSGCKVQYKPEDPKLPEKNTWKEPYTTTPLKMPQDVTSIEEVSVAHWWEIFQDEKLSSFEKEALANSPTIEQAARTLAAAKAQWKITESALFPQMDLFLGIKRNKLSQSEVGAPVTFPGHPPTTIAIPVTPQPLIPPAVPPSIVLPGTAPFTITPAQHITFIEAYPRISYEFDFWKKLEQAALSDLEQFYAQKNNLSQAALILTTTLATTYYSIISDEKELILLQKIIELFELEEALDRDQYQAGLADLRTTLTIQQQKESAQRDYETLLNDKKILEHLFSTLIGKAPGVESYEFGAFPLTIPDIPLDIPVHVLKNRPDIQQQEHIIESSRLDVGVQKAEFFPQVPISAFYGYRGDKFNNLFKWESHVWDITTQAITPLFTAGKLSNQVKQAIAQYEQNVSQLVSITLNAYQEIEDSLATIEKSNKQYILVEEEKKNLKTIVDLDESRYLAGLDSYIDYIQTKQNLLQKKRECIQITRDRVLNAITLVRSIGGSWSDV